MGKVVIVGKVVVKHVMSDCESKVFSDIDPAPDLKLALSYVTFTPNPQCRHVAGPKYCCMMVACVSGLGEICLMVLP